MSIDLVPSPITSFLDLYADHKNFHHVSLGRVGGTNFMVRLQIDQAIKDRADYVIVNTVPADRLDIVKREDGLREWFELKNIGYKGYDCVSQNNIVDYDPVIVSDTVETALNVRYDLNKDQKNAVKTYVAYLQNNHLQRQKDYYMISDGLRRLTDANIPYVLIPDLMETLDWSWAQTVWPADKPKPLDMPFGPCNDGSTVNHNNQQSHQLLFEILCSITDNWE